MGRKKLGEVLSVETIRNGNTFSKEDVLSVSDEYGCVNQIRFQGRSFAGEDISNYKIVQTGDIVYTRSPLKAKPFGIIKIVREETGIVSPLYIVNQAKVGNDPEFLYRVFDSPAKTNSYLSPLVRKGAKNTMNISEEEWLSGRINISDSFEEQKSIGDFFRQLDESITQIQAELIEWKELKKGMLQKMFPKEGKSVPEIRFPGFSREWRRRTIGELIDTGFIILQSDGNHGELYPRADEFSDSGIPYISASNISADGETIDFSHIKYLPLERARIFKKGVAKPGDVLLAHNATVGPSLMLAIDYDFAILSTSLTLYRLDETKIKAPFFLQTLRSSFFQDQLFASMKQTTRNQVPILTQRQMSIVFPELAEQECIGLFFQKLDKLIVNTQRELDTWKELKKALLQQMFV